MHPLHDRLIRAPVPDPQHRIAEHHCVPGNARRVRVGANHGEVGRVDVLLHPAPAFQRLPHAEQAGPRAVPAAQHVEPQHRNADRAQQQHHRLDRLRHDHRQQAAHDRVDGRRPADRQDRPEMVLLRMVQVGPQQDPFDHNRTGVQREADVHRNRREDREHGQIVATAPAVAPLQEIRQGGHPGADVKRREEPGQDDQRKGRHPLEVAVDQPRRVAVLGEAHQVDGGDVCGEHRHADHRPPERLAGQKIVAAAGLPLLSQPRPAAQGHDSHQVEQDDRQVHVADLDLFPRRPRLRRGARRPCVDRACPIGRRPTAGQPRRQRQDQSLPHRVRSDHCTVTHPSGT